MKTVFQQVLDFHKKFDCYIGDSPAIPDEGTSVLRLSLIKEEYDELLRALLKNNVAGIADGIADNIYVLIGTAISYGINLPAVWDVVHSHNMQKTGGKRKDGKVLKTEEDGKPNIEQAL